MSENTGWRFMRRMSIVLAAAAAGCGVAPGSLSPTALWDIYAVRATVPERNGSGQAWDVLGGLPDPLVCLTANGVRQCTTSVADTLNPSWNIRVQAGITTTAIRSGLAFTLYDEDLSSNDTICAGTEAWTDGAISSGSVTTTCTNGATIVWSIRTAQ